MRGHDQTLLCAIALCGFRVFRDWLLQAFLPESPDRPRDVAHKAAVRLPSSLAFGNAALYVGPGSREGHLP
jgi:hypothetical protein